MKYPQFLGFEVNDLFHFFLIFIALSGGAAVLLFAIHRWLKRLMHGVN